MASFTTFYYSKYNNGRMLNWKLNLGSAEIKGGIFIDGKSYEFMISTYQMFLLLLFNEHESLTYQQVL